MMKQKHLKQILAVTMIGIMSLGMLTGCGSKTENEPAKEETVAAQTEAPAEETVISFGIHVANPQEQEAVTYKIVQAFNEDNDGKYQVNFVAADTESHKKNMKLQASDGTLPEIFWMDAAASEFVEAGLVLDLSEFLAENADIDTALNGMEDAFAADIQYGLPYQCNVQGIFFNKAVFDEAGVAYPTNATTYDEFIAMIGDLKAAGVIPLSIGSKNSGFAMWEFNEFLSRYGWAENIDAILAGEKAFNNADFAACFEKVKGIAEAGAFPENMATIEYFDAKQLFNKGTAAMFGTGQWDCGEFDTNIGENIGFFWGPVFEDSAYEQEVAMKVPSAPILVSAAVAEDENVKEAVYEFLKFYYGEEAAKISCEGSVFPATSYNVSASNTQYAMNTMLAAMADGWTSPAAAPDQTIGSAVQTELYNSLFGVMQGTYSPEEALDKMDETLSYQ